MLLSRTKGVFLLFCFIAALHLVARPVLAVTGGSSGSFSSLQKSKTSSSLSRKANEDSYSSGTGSSDSDEEDDELVNAVQRTTALAASRKPNSTTAPRKVMKESGFSSGSGASDEKIVASRPLSRPATSPQHARRKPSSTAFPSDARRSASELKPSKKHPVVKAADDESSGSGWDGEDDDGDGRDWGEWDWEGGATGRRPAGPPRARTRAAAAAATAARRPPPPSLGGGGGGGGGGGRLRALADQARAAARELKGLVSSELEAVLLKATRPTDLPVKDKHLDALLFCCSSTPQEFDVYTPVLKKLWAKANEGDWRSAVKAAFVIHSFARKGPGHHAAHLKSLPRTLSGQYCAKLRGNYFDVERLVFVGEEGGGEVAAYAKFARRYVEYALARARLFAPGFPELGPRGGDGDGGGGGGMGGKALRQEVEELVAAALRVPRKAAEDGSPLVLKCLQEIALDLQDLFDRFGKQLLRREMWNSQVVDATETLPADTQARIKELNAWADFYSERAPKIEGHLRKVAKIVSLHSSSEPLFKTSLPEIPSSLHRRH